MADFKNLRVWRHAQALTIKVDEVSRKIRDADYSPVRRQLIKTALSVTANIVEGREKHSEKEFVRHLEIAKGSVTELEQHLISARDLRLVSESDFQSLTDQVKEVRKMLSGLLKRVRMSLEERKRNAGSA